jgi:ribosomal protein L2
MIWGKVKTIEYDQPFSTYRLLVYEDGGKAYIIAPAGLR